MTNLSNERFHVGIYAILVNEGKILLVKKSRGAYKGMFDLPGGGIEFGERIEDTLRRELFEETGLSLDKYSFFGNNEYFCDYHNESGDLRKLHHLGIYFKVSAPFERVKNVPDGQDSLGAEFIELQKLDTIQIAPIAKQMIDKLGVE